MVSQNASGPSNYDHLWKCNQAPTEDEASQIKAAVQGLKVAFARVTGRPSTGTFLDAAGGQTPARAVKARKIEEAIRRHEMLLSGVRRIPIEIWQKIFLLSLSDLENQNPYNPYDKALRVLCSVSREWSAVAKGYPNLWVRFPTFDFGPAWAYLNYGKRTLNRLEQYMSLSDRKPFTFGFFLHEDNMTRDSPRYLPVANDMFKRLVGECHRWKGALLYLADPEYEGEWPVELARVKGCLPELSSLNLTVGTKSASAWSKSVAALFSDAPKLRHVVFHTPREAAEGGLLNLELPWSQLETFGGACRANDSFTKLLENTTGNLTSLKCELNCTPGMPMPIFHAVPLPILTTLYLQFTSSQPVLLMMHLIQLPSLEDLKLDGTELNPSLRQPIFMAALRLIARSSCPLKRLGMSFQFPDPPTTAELSNFISLLRTCESLTDTGGRGDIKRGKHVT
ncbi:hypothetical protein NMY22_g13933 [Coprinellus aureogranulatus]|nr:hypothetical protein NMY22_g13933 [Coprinellus aureogranulatus]